MTSTVNKNTTKNRNSDRQTIGKRIMGGLSKVGKALLVPIAVLPLAAIFLRLGAAIPGDTPFALFVSHVFNAIGGTVFGYLPIIFAVGIAFGLTKDHRGEAALAGLIGMLLMQLMLKSGSIVNDIYGNVHLDGHVGFEDLFGDKYTPIMSENVLNGFVSGALVAWAYNRFNDVELPKVLSFFGGRRLAVVLAIIVITGFGLIWAVVFPWIGYGLYELSTAMHSATGNRWGNASIAGVYGVLNRLLIPFGVHHVPNTLFWFTLGEYPDSTGAFTINGDINGFSKGVATLANGASAHNTAGTFQTGFFPAMMFGLPAMVGAFYFLADGKEQKRKVIAVFGGAAVISFLTGITEPIEYAFLFLAPALYGAHALLTGVFAFIANAFGMQIGFGFSAGLIDYAVSIPKSIQLVNANNTGFARVMDNPGWMWVVGAAAGVTYFFTTVLFAKKFGVDTPGRGKNLIVQDVEETSSTGTGLKPQGAAIIKAFGGWDNIKEFGNCTTRLRYEVVDPTLVEDQALLRAGAIGVSRPSKYQIQAIIGTQVEQLNQNITSNKGAPLDGAKAVQAVKTAPAKGFSSASGVVSGTVKELKSMDNGSFALMGDGIAIAPAENARKVTSPVDGKVTVAFPGGHAYGITTSNGVEYLIHIGVDTVKLEGDGFTPKVKVGDTVKAGDTLTGISIAKLKKAKSTDIAVVVTSGQTVVNKAEGDVTYSSNLFETK